MDGLSWGVGLLRAVRRRVASFYGAGLPRPVFCFDDRVSHSDDAWHEAAAPALNTFRKLPAACRRPTAPQSRTTIATQRRSTTQVRAAWSGLLSGLLPPPPPPPLPTALSPSSEESSPSPSPCRILPGAAARVPGGLGGCQRRQLALGTYDPLNSQGHACCRVATAPPAPPGVLLLHTSAASPAVPARRAPSSASLWTGGPARAASCATTCTRSWSTLWRRWSCSPRSLPRSCSPTCLAAAA